MDDGSQLKVLFSHSKNRAVPQESVPPRACHVMSPLVDGETLPFVVCLPPNTKNSSRWSFSSQRCRQPRGWPRSPPADQFFCLGSFMLERVGGSTPRYQQLTIGSIRNAARQTLGARPPPPCRLRCLMFDVSHRRPHRSRASVPLSGFALLSWTYEQPRMTSFLWGLFTCCKQHLSADCASLPGPR